MDVIIVCNFCGQPSESSNSRFLYLARQLAANNEVEIITSDYSHGKKKRKAEETASIPFTMTRLHEPGYQKNVSLRRLYSHFVWGRNVKRYLEQRKKPDVVYCAVPSLSGPLAIANYCEKNKIHFVIDVQDLWPEAFQMVFHVPVLSAVIFWPLKRIANAIYKRADDIVAVSDTYVDRALSVNRKCCRGTTVYLGTDLAGFDNNCRLKQDVVPEKNGLWLAYCGTLGASYDLTTVMDALALLKRNGGTVPTFVIMGDGPRRAEFEEYAKAKSLAAVFTGKLPYPEMCAWLKACDIAVNPIAKGAAGSIINKHADYAACGLPVINSQENKEYRALVEKYKMGFNCKNGDARDMAEKLSRLLSDTGLRRQMGKNARTCAEENFDRRYTYQKIYKVIGED